MDIMQEFKKDILNKNKDVLQRLKCNNPLNQDSADMFSRVKNALSKGYPVYAIVEHDNVTRNVEIIDSGRWDADSVKVKLRNGSELSVHIDCVKMVKC